MRDEQSALDSAPDWWPTDYIDEIMPAPRASPDAWIVYALDAPMLAAADDGETPEQVLTDGTIVNFTSRVTHDVIDLTLTADGHRFEQEPPTGFEQCCILYGWQSETLSDDIDSMMDQLRDSGAEPGEYLASFYTFDHGTDYRFVAATTTFEKVEP